ncbi:MAG: hypothetical protein C0478_16375 [Planctomyces sp.]|nr:hypothetical protein [Planctomyces sp.]
MGFGGHIAIHILSIRSPELFVPIVGLFAKVEMEGPSNIDIGTESASVPMCFGLKTRIACETSAMCLQARWIEMSHTYTHCPNGL